MSAWQMTLKRSLLASIAFLAIVPFVSLRTGAAVVNPRCKPGVDAFLSMPNEDSATDLARLDQDGCWSLVQSSNSTLDRLTHWVERGNQSAAEYLAKHVNQLDGGNLEDALTALGEFGDHDMERLLRFANEGSLSERELRDSLTMLPLSLSDNPRAQFNLLTARKSKVSRVTRSNLSEQRIEALKAINDFISEVRSKSPEIGR